ncbi:MAG: Phosphate-import permease protein PhnE [Firmicutes bacterium]|nr:Phosphate-import permease protein PhnE [Bacillota bacterium]
MKRRSLFNTGLGVVLFVVFVWSLVDLGIGPRLFWRGLPHFFRLVSEMFPPSWEVLTEPDILWSVVETLSMAFLGTFFGAAAAFVLALWAASNLTPSRLVRETVKALMAAERSMPTLVVVLVLIVVIGLGPFTGMVTVAIGSIGMLGRLFAEAMENVDPRPLDSLKSTGASKLQIIRYAVLPQVVPSLIANTLYRFDINLRTVLFLGVVGGGGIGFHLHLAMSLFRYADALAITAVILSVIWMAEQLSNHLRSVVIGRETLR